MGQISFFTALQTSGMRDCTKRRNYSAEAEEFRGEQAGRRDRGLQQRHARKMQRLHGSTVAAWATYRDRVDEALTPPGPATAGQADPSVRAGSDIVTQTPPAGPAPAAPDAVPAVPKAIPPSVVAPEAIAPVVAPCTQPERIPIISGTTTSEHVTPAAIRTVTATAEPSRTQTAPTVTAPLKNGLSATSTQAVQSESDPIATNPSAAKPITADPSVAKPSAAKPITAVPIVANPSAAKPITADPSVAKPSAAKPPPARRAAAAASCLRRCDYPARRSRPGRGLPVSAGPVDRPSFTHRANAKPASAHNDARIGEGGARRLASTRGIQPAKDTHNPRADRSSARKS
ncbi:hypothetical protein ACIA5C_16615 [Actinoplanes sp. NPDC051343]|uniref:hypothetical protein n=1 Tax=Actinoplanes sp. NPDC051343 TaxID=3363906 RepID=UPI0037A2F82B